MHGHDGLDELTTTGPNRISRLIEGEIVTETLDPADLGLATVPIQALAGGDLATNRAILEAVLQGRGSRAQSDVVALNTALVLWAAGRAASVAEGLEQAQAALASGGGWQALERLRQALPAPAAG